MSHSPEPWRENEKGQIVGADGSFVADWCVGAAFCEEMGDFIEPDNRARIIAAVNACRGITTDELSGCVFAKTDWPGTPTYLLEKQT